MEPFKFAEGIDTYLELWCRLVLMIATTNIKKKPPKIGDWIMHAFMAPFERSV